MYNGFSGRGLARVHARAHIYATQATKTLKSYECVRVTLCLSIPYYMLPSFLRNVGFDGCASARMMNVIPHTRTHTHSHPKTTPKPPHHLPTTHAATHSLSITNSEHDDDDDDVRACILICEHFVQVILKSISKSPINRPNCQQRFSAMERVVGRAGQEPFMYAVYRLYSSLCVYAKLDMSWVLSRREH